MARIEAKEITWSTNDSQCFGYVDNVKLFLIHWDESTKDKHCWRLVTWLPYKLTKELNQFTSIEEAMKKGQRILNMFVIKMSILIEEF